MHYLKLLIKIILKTIMKLLKNLVLGYIQSGKTTSMEAVACMARDNGFKLTNSLIWTCFKFNGTNTGESL